MHNRLSAVKVTQDSCQTQLRELRTAIEAEAAARPESVRNLVLECNSSASY